jgi:hypothetical protein
MPRDRSRKRSRSKSLFSLAWPWVHDGDRDGMGWDGMGWDGMSFLSPMTEDPCSETKIVPKVCTAKQYPFCFTVGCMRESTVQDHTPPSPPDRPFEKGISIEVCFSCRVLGTCWDGGGVIPVPSDPTIEVR